MNQRGRVTKVMRSGRGVGPHRRRTTVLGRIWGRGCGALRQREAREAHDALAALAALLLISYRRRCVSAGLTWSGTGAIRGTGGGLG